MNEELEELLKSAMRKAESTGELDDFNKAAGVAKAIAEACKARADIANARGQMRLEGLKSLATFLVPVVSFLAITFTVYIQFLQLQETQRQNEATQWRDFLTSAKVAPNSLTSDPTFAPRLRSFFDSPTYRNQALNISKRMMGNIANPAAFRDLFGVTFTSIDASSIVDVIDVGRLLFQNLDNVYSECSRYVDDLDEATKEKMPKFTRASGICAPIISERVIRGLGLSPKDTERLGELRRNVVSFENENSFVSDQIAPFIRSNYSTGSSNSPAKPLSLSKLWISWIDLSNVDFTEIDLTDTILDGTNLDGAKLTPKKFGGALDIRSSAWWDVESIEQKGLPDLVENRYPYYFEDEAFPNGKIVAKDHYLARIAALCVPAMPSCAPEQLKFGKPADPAAGTANK